MTSTARSGRPCTALNKRGKPCGAYCLPGSDFCPMHDPTRAAERAAAHSAGGKARHGRTVGPVGQAEPVELKTPGDVLSLITRAVNETLKLENGVNRNRTLGTLALAALKVFEISELEQRVAALEAIQSKGA